MCKIIFHLLLIIDDILIIIKGLKGNKFQYPESGAQCVNIDTPTKLPYLYCD